MFQTLPSTVALAPEDIWAVFQQQRRICSQYIQLAREGNYHQEALRMRQANELMERLSKREKVKDLSEWDVFSTRDSVVLEQEGSFNLSALSNDSRSRTITRKNGLVSRSLRDIQSGLQQALNEIEHHCNAQTVGIVKRLAEEYKKLRGKAQENEKKERFARVSQKLLQQLQEKNLVLTNKLDDYEQQLTKLRNEITQLRNENKDLTDTIFKRDHQINSEKKIKLYEEIACAKTPYLTPTKVQEKTSISILSKVYAQKEKILTSRYQQIRQIEGKIEVLLFSSSEETTIKKVKESIKLYRSYLQQQSQAFQRFVDQFREQILERQILE